MFDYTKRFVEAYYERVEKVHFLMSESNEAQVFAHSNIENLGN